MRTTELLEQQLNATVNRLAVQESMMTEMVDIVAHLQNKLDHQALIIRELQATVKPVPMTLALPSSHHHNRHDSTSDLGSTSTLYSLEDKDRDVKEIVVKPQRKKIYPDIPLSPLSDKMPSLPQLKDISSIKDKLMPSTIRGTPLGKSCRCTPDPSSTHPLTNH